MARPRRIDAKLVAKAQAALTQAHDVNQLRAAQAILLPALAHTTLEQTAALGRKIEALDGCGYIPCIIGIDRLW